MAYDDDDDVCNRTGEEEGGGWKTMHNAQKGALDSIDSERRQRQRNKIMTDPLGCSVSLKKQKDSIMPPGRRQAMDTKDSKSGECCSSEPTTSSRNECEVYDEIITNQYKIYIDTVIWFIKPRCLFLNTMILLSVRKAWGRLQTISGWVNNAPISLLFNYLMTPLYK